MARELAEENEDKESEPKVKREMLKARDYKVTFAIIYDASFKLNKE